MRHHQHFFLIAALLVAACKTTQPVLPPPEPQPEPIPEPPAVPVYADLAPDLARVLVDPYDDTRAVEVLYVTNRVPGTNRVVCGPDTYGVELSGDMQFGVCRMNVPKRHHVGEIEVTTNPRSDPHQYFRSLSHRLLDKDGLAEHLRDSQDEVLTFVHGFNVGFGEAVVRAAQIAYDLKFQGQVMVMSWPAGARAGVFNRPFISRTYAQNRENAQASVDTISGVFRYLAELDNTFHFMVHSMGHQVVIPALAQASRDMTEPFIGELVLNAPDIPIEEFRDAAPSLPDVAARTTVYCSYNDRAIAASEAYNDNRRLGACDLIDGVDVINVGDIDAPTLGVGHGYYASRPILTDIFQLLLGIPAENRLFIRRSEPNSTENFYLRR